MRQTLAQHFENAKHGLSKYRVLIPLALMIVPQITKTLSPGATEDDVHEAQMNIAYLLGFSVLSEVITSVIGNARQSDNAVNATASTIALVTASTAAIASGVMFAEPGEAMTKYGPWIIGVSSSAAYLAMHYAMKEIENIPTTTSGTPPSLLEQAAEAAGNPVGAIAITALPIMIAEIIERCMSIAHNDKLKLIAPFVADGSWALGSAIQTVLTAVAASSNLRQNKKVIDALFLMVMTEVAGLTILATLAGHADAMNVSAPFIGRALLLAAMGCSAKVRMEIAAEYISTEGIRGIAAGTNILNKVAVLFRDTGIAMMLAIKAMHESDPQKTLYRKSMEGVLFIQALDSMATFALSLDLPKTEWTKPAFFVFAIQALMLGLTLIEPTGAVGKNHVDIRPALGIISAFSYYLFKQIKDLHCQRAMNLANHVETGGDTNTRASNTSNESMQGKNDAQSVTAETPLVQRLGHPRMRTQLFDNFWQYSDGVAQGILVYSQQGTANQYA